MNAIALGFSVLGMLAMLVLPRKWAVAPLLIGACYMTMAQRISLGPFDFTMVRLLIAAGLLRVLLRGERLTGGTHGLDRVMMAWGVWALLASLYYSDVSAALVFRMGLTYSTLGVYFLVRIFCQSLDDVIFALKVTAFLLAPIAMEMVMASYTGYNFFAMFGGVTEVAAERHGRIRAQGPFAHSILAGMVGAGCMPMLIGLWRTSRLATVVGVASSLIIVMASASSGPLLAMVAGGFAWFMWRHQTKVRTLLWLGLGGYVVLDLLMKAPGYYLINRIPLVGGTGWHRAQLINAAIEHLGEWWWAGSENTRHWIASGVTWSPDHVDITNHYIKMGVLGGLPLMLLFIACFVLGFVYLGRLLRRQDVPEDQRFVLWGLASSLFAYAVICLTISFFDQSYLFLYLNMAAVGSMYALLRQVVAASCAEAVPDDVSGLDASVTGLWPAIDTRDEWP